MNIFAPRKIYKKKQMNQFTAIYKDAKEEVVVVVRGMPNTEREAKKIE